MSRGTEPAATTLRGGLAQADGGHGGRHQCRADQCAQPSAADDGRAASAMGAFISDTPVPLSTGRSDPLCRRTAGVGVPAHRGNRGGDGLGDHQGYEQHSCARSLPQALPQRHLRRHGTGALAGTQADEGGQRAGSQAKDGDGPSTCAAGRGSRSPARTSPSPVPDSLSRSEAIKRISVWIERDFLNDNVTYAEVVDWYDQGTINRDAVLTDRANTRSDGRSANTR